MDCQTASLMPVRNSESSLAEFVFQYGCQPDSYLATAPGRRVFWSQHGRGLVSYAVSGRYVLVSGGLICPADERENLLMQFLQYCAGYQWRVIFFFIPEDCIDVFRRLGCYTTKIGEDSVLDLEQLTFCGGQWEWVRRQVNYCRRHHVTFREVDREKYSELEWQRFELELRAVCESSMTQKAQQMELQFLDGTIDGHALGRRRLFIAETCVNGISRIEGYVVCNPLMAGMSWAAEIYRHRHDSVRGTIAYLFHQIALQLKQEGVLQFSLCLAPGQNCEQHVPHERPIVRRMILLLRDRGSAFFDMQGICYFKSRFRPRYQNCYICSPAVSDRFPLLVAVGGLLATLRVLGLLRVSPRQLWKMWRLGRNRKRPVEDVASNS